MTFGMTMGVGLVVGSLVGGLLGGGAGYFGARLKNRGAASGGNSMQLSDEMLPELVMLAQMRYLTACHLGRIYAARKSELQDLWREMVVESVREKNDALLRSWSEVRLSKAGDNAKSAFTLEMETIALNVLAKLYPEANVCVKHV